MRVVAIELPHRCDAAREQLVALDEALDETKPGDLVLLPELALQGYVSARGNFDRTHAAEAIDGPLASALAERARAREIYLAGGIVEREGRSAFNTLTLHDPFGELVLSYRKRHPWFPETWATPGSDPHPLITIDSVRVAAAICFDVHFLAEEAHDVLSEADVLLFASAWVEDEGDQRFELLPELARRYSLWIVNANWGAGVPEVRTQGRSIIVDPSGRVVRETHDGERAISADITLTDA